MHNQFKSLITEKMTMKHNYIYCITVYCYQLCNTHLRRATGNIQITYIYIKNQCDATWQYVY